MQQVEDEVEAVITDKRMEEILMEMKNSDWRECLKNCSRIMELNDEAILITSQKIKEHFHTKELFEEKKDEVKNLLLLGLDEKDREVVKVFNIYKGERISSETIQLIRKRYNYIWCRKLEARFQKLKDMTYGIPLIIEDENLDVSSIVTQIESERNSSSQKKSSTKLADNLEDTTKRLSFSSPDKSFDETDDEVSGVTEMLDEKLDLNENKKGNTRIKAFKKRHKLIIENENYEDAFYTKEQDIVCMLKILHQFENKIIYDPCCGKLIIFNAILFLTHITIYR
jgi:hypothetical protein